MSEYEPPNPPSIEDLPEEAIEGLSFLRAHTAGILRFDGDFIPIKTVLTPEGRLVAPVMIAMLRSVDCALFLPEEPKDEDDPVLQLQVELEQFQEDGPAGADADRWRIYHGDPPDVNWAYLTIDAAKMSDIFISGEALHIPNTLSAIEAALCREINSSHDEALRAALIRETGIEIETPRLVGVDPLGFDVRGRFDIMRIPSGRILKDGDDAKNRLYEILGISK